MKDGPFFINFFSFNLISFVTFSSRYQCLVIIVLPFFLLPLYHLLLISLFSFPLLWICYVHLLSVPGIQFSSKSFDNDAIECYKDLPYLNSESNTEVDKCETQLRICRDTAMFCLLLKLVLSCKINKTIHVR